MRELILPRRTDMPLLTLCKHMVMQSLPDELRPFLVEALFDYQPEEWYIDAAPPSPPPFSETDRPAKKTLTEIGKFALKKLNLTPRQEDAVKSVLRDL